MKIAARAAATAVILIASLVAHPLPAGASPTAPAKPPAPSATPSSAPSPAAGAHTIDMDGWKRPYLLRVPDRRTRPLPLIVAMHGGLNDPAYVERQSGLNALAASGRFAVAYPEGLLGTWNAGGCCWFARWFGVDDVAFLDRLIATLVRQGVADPRRVFLTGFSNGGGMAYRYACERADRVAGIAVVSGALAVGCAPRRAVSVLAFHGTWDPSVPYTGGGNMDADVKVPFLPVQAVMEFWRWIGRLPALTRPVRGAPDGCAGTGPGRVVVALCTIERGGHEWPSFASALMGAFFDSRPSLPRPRR
ncbi:alpha/beta hydrolase family esterase [Spirillospora albida]|uniref:alpha/beta hydrolase family esterase n=1 Tax=Spirillospora albida TaxID=58123 RepID=UPI000ABC9529|nr:PHB depolymerase family esterase [Spirillospora albida]